MKRRAPKKSLRSTPLPMAPKWRLAACGVVFLLIWAALWVRAGDLQLMQGAEYAQKARQQHMTAETRRGKRGDILDRNGRPLARSVWGSSVYAHPGEIVDVNRSASALSKVLGVSRRTLKKKLTSDKPFVWLARQVDDRTGSAVTGLNLPGVGLKDAFTRVYPGKHLAGQVVGFTNVDGVGVEGLERTLEDVLKGRTERKVLRLDGRRGQLEIGDALEDIKSVDGRDVYLTIDAYLQAEAENALSQAVTEHQAEWGVCLVVEVATGDILAMANYPFFNPNNYRSSSAKLRRNRAAMDMFEPGSTMKPLMAAAALEEGIVSPASVIDCENGAYTLTGKTIRDTHEYGELTFADVVAYSSNIGLAKVGLELGPQRMHGYLEQLGYGHATALPLPAETAGLLRPWQGWYPLDVAAVSFGQGVGVTALQMAQAYLTLTEDGGFKPLRLVREQKSAPGGRVFSPATAAAVRSMLVLAVEEGTGKNARLPGVVVGGKTGTAQKASPQGGYADAYVSNFVGLVPGDAPELLVLAVIDDPKKQHYGGVVAAPVVRQVMASALAYTGRLSEPAPSSLPSLVDSTGETLPLMDCGPQARGLACSALPTLNIVDEEPEAALPPEIAALAQKLEGDEPKDDAVRMPDVRGVSLKRAVQVLARQGVIPKVRGTGSRIVAQRPAPGARWKSGGAMLTLGSAAVSAKITGKGRGS